MKHNFKNYYLTMFGDFSLSEIDSVISLIDFLHEVNFEYKIGDDYFITTFSSFLNIKELDDLIKEFKIDFVLTEINRNFSFKFLNKETQDDLFGLVYNENKKMEDITNSILDEITDAPPSSNIRNPNTKSKVRRQKRLKSEYYKNLNKTQKEEMINNILDKGVDNISDYDRRVLSIISKGE